MKYGRKRINKRENKKINQKRVRDNKMLEVIYRDKKNSGEDSS